MREKWEIAVQMLSDERLSLGGKSTDEVREVERQDKQQSGRQMAIRLTD